MKSLKSTVGISLALLLFSSFSAVIRPHLVGTVVINEVNEKIQLIATLDKTTLAYAARLEGDCSTVDLMRQTCSNYFLKHFKVQLNGKNVHFVMKKMELAGDKVCITFEDANINETIKSVRVSSNYFQEINDGAQTQIILKMKEQSSSFILDQHKLSNLTSYGVF